MGGEWDVERREGGMEMRGGHESGVCGGVSVSGMGADMLDVDCELPLNEPVRGGVLVMAAGESVE